jgi:hypothetical protein
MHSFLPSPARHMDGTWLILSRDLDIGHFIGHCEIVTNACPIMVRQHHCHKLIAYSKLIARRLREPTLASQPTPALHPSNPPSHPPTPPPTPPPAPAKPQRPTYIHKSARRASTATPTPTHSLPPLPSTRAIPSQRTSNRGPERWNGCKMSGSTSSGT